MPAVNQFNSFGGTSCGYQAYRACVLWNAYNKGGDVE